jgi:hypothetical protein
MTSRIDSHTIKDKFFFIPTGKLGEVESDQKVQFSKDTLFYGTGRQCIDLFRSQVKIELIKMGSNTKNKEIYREIALKVNKNDYTISKDNNEIVLDSWDTNGPITRIEYGEAGGINFTFYTYLLTELFLRNNGIDVSKRIK